jgi:signal peptidase
MLSFLQNPRQAAAQLLNFGLILSTAFMMWKGLSVLADSPSPIVVVLSGSMEPAFQRGDLLFLWNRNFFEETKVGEIVVYNVKGKDIPIVHRVVRKFGVGWVLPLSVAESGEMEDGRGVYSMADWQGIRRRHWSGLIGHREKAKLLTKGDNNVADDTELYARGQDYLERKDIIGSVFAYIPFVGYVTILLSEHPWLKTVMLGIMGLVVVLQRE